MPPKFEKSSFFHVMKFIFQTFFFTIINKTYFNEKLLTKFLEIKLRKYIAFIEGNKTYLNTTFNNVSSNKKLSLVRRGGNLGK